jgi:hypothetical protein
MRDLNNPHVFKFRLKWVYILRLTLSSIKLRSSLFSLANALVRFRCSRRKFEAWSEEPMLPSNLLTEHIASFSLE